MPSAEEDLKLSNIPMINLRHEFFLWNRGIRSQKFGQQFEIGYRQPIRTPLLIWGGNPGDLLTLILQRAILGLESYVGAAVWIELGRSGRLTPELHSQVRNPFTIKSKKKGTAYRYYNTLPAFLDPKYALENWKTNAALWSEMSGFYKTVRNKILHGYQIGSRSPGVLVKYFDMFAQTYEWVNSWHTLEVRGAKGFRITFQLQCLP
jgi:hypothetical protein